MHIDSYAISVPWFLFNIWYSDFILIIWIAYVLIIQSYHISFHFNHTEAYRYVCNHDTLISFQSPVLWFHFNQNSYIWTYNSVITYHTNSTALKHKDTYVTMKPSFLFNLQYSSFISTKCEHIIQSSHIILV